VSSSPSPQLGSVVWAELADSNGICKIRPAVVVSPTADIAAGRALRVAAITTRLANPLPKDHVLLPWDRQGKARSGLRRKCAAVVTWLAELPVSAVQQVVGILPPVVMAELLAKIHTLPAPSTAEGAPSPPGGAAGKSPEKSR